MSLIHFIYTLCTIYINVKLNTFSLHIEQNFLLSLYDTDRLVAL